MINHHSKNNNNFIYQSWKTQVFNIAIAIYQLGFDLQNTFEMYMFVMKNYSLCQKKNLTCYYYFIICRLNIIPFFRQMVARTVLDTLRQVSENSTDVGTVFDIVTRLAQDVGKLGCQVAQYHTHTTDHHTCRNRLGKTAAFRDLISIN